MGSPDDAGMSEAGSGDAGLLRDIENAEKIAAKRGLATCGFCGGRGYLDTNNVLACTVCGGRGSVRADAPIVKLGQGDTARACTDAGGGVLREDDIDPMLAELRKITQCFEEAAQNIRAELPALREEYARAARRTTSRPN